MEPSLSSTIAEDIFQSIYLYFYTAKETDTTYNMIHKTQGGAKNAGKHAAPQAPNNTGVGKTGNTRTTVTFRFIGTIDKYSQLQYGAESDGGRRRRETTKYHKKKQGKTHAQSRYIWA